MQVFQKQHREERLMTILAVPTESDKFFQANALLILGIAIEVLSKHRFSLE